MNTFCNRPSRIVGQICFSAAVLVMLGMQSVLAQTSSKNPFEYVSPHATVPEAAEIWKQVNETDKSLRAVLEKIAKDATPDAKQVAQASVHVRQLGRYVERLQQLKEPAAIDLSFRKSVYYQSLLTTITRFWGVPASTPVRQRVVTGLARSEKQRIQTLQKIAQESQTDPPAAEKQLDKLMDEVYATAGCLSPEESKPINIPIDECAGIVNSAMGGARSARTRAVFEEEMTRYLKEFQTLVAQTEQAVTQGCKTEVEGAALAGPEALQALIKKWSLAHVGIQRAATLAANRNAATGYSDSFSSSGGGQPEDDSFSGPASEAHDRMLKAVLAFVGTDLASPQGKEKYPHYVRILAELSARYDFAPWQGEAEKTLMTAATKLGTIEQVLAYNQATTDLLRWRARAASARTKKLAATYPRITDKARSLLSSNEQKVGLYPKDRSLPVLTKAGPELAPIVQQAFDAANVHVGQVRRLDGDKPLWMSRLDGNWYTMTTIAFSDVSRQRLESDLQLATFPAPLSIEPAAALYALRAGDCEAVGGAVGGVTFEGALSRMAKLPEIAGQLVPLGSIYLAAERNDPLSNLILRFELKPTWLQHKHFVEELVTAN